MSSSSITDTVKFSRSMSLRCVAVVTKNTTAPSSTSTSVVLMHEVTTFRRSPLRDFFFLLICQSGL